MSKFGFRTFSQKLDMKGLIFCMMTEENRGHHLSMVPLLWKILKPID